MATRVEAEWALRYGSNGRIAATPTEPHRVLASARDAYRATYKVPDWFGVELLRGWAFCSSRWTGPPAAAATPAPRPTARPHERRSTRRPARQGGPLP